jgi:hypothetical protein
MLRGEGSMLLPLNQNLCFVAKVGDRNLNKKISATPLQVK